MRINLLTNINLVKLRKPKTCDQTTPKFKLLIDLFSKKQLNVRYTLIATIAHRIIGENRWQLNTNHFSLCVLVVLNGKS